MSNRKMDSFEKTVIDKLEGLAIQVGILVNDMRDVKSTQGEQRSSIDSLKALWAKAQTIDNSEKKNAEIQTDLKDNYATKTDLKSLKVQFGIISALVIGAATIILRAVFESLVQGTLK